MLQAVVSVVAGLLLVAVAGLSWVLVAILRQQGRVLLRLEALERQPPATAGAAHGARAAFRGEETGTAVGSFALEDPYGQRVTLEDFRGKRVLLVHWDPACGFCEQIATELAALDAPLRRRNTELVLVTHGTAESNRAFSEGKALNCRILLQESQRVDVFETMGTPVAYWLDEQGRVAAPLAVGATEVVELARSVAESDVKPLRIRPVSSSRIERAGLDAGAPAPSFTLPDLEGRPVSLTDYRGRRVLLVFSDPACGPCDELARDLVRTHRQEDGDSAPAVIIVSRGSEDENRRKAREHEIPFPVVIQRGWTLSRQYGMFATPIAFLISEEGEIAAKVATGRDEILALAAAPLTA
jgi:peroxiredoxin